MVVIIPLSGTLAFPEVLRGANERVEAGGDPTRSLGSAKRLRGLFQALAGAA